MVARSTDNLETSTEGSRNLGNTSGASIKGKPPKRFSVAKGPFPKLAECAHFHYENVDFGCIQLLLSSDRGEDPPAVAADGEPVCAVQVTCQGKSWLVHRNYDEFQNLDTHLHLCIFDRRFSQLPELPPFAEIRHRTELLMPMLSQYLEKLSAIIDSNINCGPVLTWMEIDNHGNRLIVNEEASINVPAIAAAHVIKRYTAQANDELSFEVGDFVSVIDMPPKEDTSWWRGKHGFQVGFFPSECVELFTERLTPGMKSEVDGQKVSAAAVPAPQGLPSPTSVSRKHGKLVGFLRTFMKSRPSKQRLKQRGILKERVFSCDLGEHLLNSGYDVPQVLRCCSEFIEKHGIVDGIYRLSGVSSNIQKLRHEFDSERIPDLTKDVYLQDIHCVSSLCKLYFRELPNPLLTYQLYDKFAEAMSFHSEGDRLIRVHDVIQQLPPPHYRTLEFLMRHLSRLATHSTVTSMHVKNLAIVWAPNLLRSMEIEAVGLNGADAFREVRVQSVVVEFLLSNVDILFSDKFTSIGKDNAGQCALMRPKSLLVSCPSTRLLSLEEAQARCQAHVQLSGHSAQNKIMAVEGASRGVLAVQDRYHTVLDFPDERRKSDAKLRKAAGGSWRLFFAMGKTPASLRKKSQLGELFNIEECPAGGRAETVTLRSAKSEESLSSQTSGAGIHKLHRLRRPRSSSDAFPVSADSNLPGLKSCRSCESLESEGRDSVYTVPDFSRRASMWMEDDEMDFSPPFLEAGSLDFDPLSFQCSPPRRSLVEDSDSSPESLFRRKPSSMRKVPDDHCHTSTPLGNPPRSAPVLGSDVTSPLRERLPKSFSFTRKVARALSPRGSRSPPMDISEPISITIPAKVLEMLGSKAGDGQGTNATGTSTRGPQKTQSPPQMISMLLKSCDIQLSESCQQEIQRKLSLGETKVKTQPAENTSTMVESSKTPEAEQHQDQHPVLSPTPASILRHLPPPPPPKNPARLMALALAESAQRALSAPGMAPLERAVPLPSQFRRSLSLECGETLPPGSAYSAVRPQTGVGKPGGAAPLQRQHSESGLRLSTHHREKKHPQVSGPTQKSSGHSRKVAGETPVGGRCHDGMGSNTTTHPERPPAYQGRPQPPISSAPLPPCQLQGKDSLHASANLVPSRTSENLTRNSTVQDGRGTTHQLMAQPKPPHLQQFYHAKSGSLPSSSANLPFRAMPASRHRPPYKPSESVGKAMHPISADRGDGVSGKPAELNWTTQTTRMPGLPNPNFPFLAEVRQPLKHRNSFPAYNKGSMPPHAPLPQDESPQGKQENLYYEIISDSPGYPQNPRSTTTHWGSPLRLSGFPPQQGRPGNEYLSTINASYGVLDQPWREPLFPFATPFSAPTHDMSSPYPTCFPRQSYPPFKSQPSWQQVAGRPTTTRMEVPPDPEALAYQRLTAAPGGTPPPASTTQLQPFFENGKVCYKYVTSSNTSGLPEVVDRTSSVGPPSMAPACTPLPEVREVEEVPEPIYVNFPFYSKLAGIPPNSESQQQQHALDGNGAQETPKMKSPQPEITKMEQNCLPSQQRLPSNSGIQIGQVVQSHYDNVSGSKSENSGRPEIAHTKSRSDPGLESHQRPIMPPHPRRSAGATFEAQSPPDPCVQDSERITQPQMFQLAHTAPDHLTDLGRPRWPHGAPSPHQPTLWQESNRRMPSPGLYKQMYDVLPCGNTILRFYRPPPAYWGPSGGHTLSASYSSIIPNMDYDIPIITYDAHFENLPSKPSVIPRDETHFDVRARDAVGKALQGGPNVECLPENFPMPNNPCVPYGYQVYGNQPNNMGSAGGHYGNIDRKEDAVTPGFPSAIPKGSSPLRQGPCLAPTWTRSYC
ncbi:rho GTPase-activating protein 33 isoform X2 [Ambystoma mexicanum]|uniref:rho GTPase-activating protein 33 isoform X2 n=1 Tax=Ambystoma mexicanum TaxID=8296 RepID=UPI0037E920CD